MTAMMASLCEALILVLVCCGFCDATPAEECRCGADAGRVVLATGQMSEGITPIPEVIGVGTGGEPNAIDIATTGLRPRKVVLRSTDGGRNWSPQGEYRPQWASPSDPTVVYAYREPELFSRSADGGQHWTEPRFLVDGRSKEEFAQSVSRRTHSYLVVTLAAIHPQLPQTVYAALSVSADPGEGFYRKTYDVPGFYLSNDGGDHWSLFSSVVGNVGQGREPTPPALGISPSGPNTMIAQAATGVVRSLDGGKTWGPVGEQAELNRRPVLRGYAEAVAQVKRKWPEFEPPRSNHLNLDVLYVHFRPDTSRVVYLVTNKGLYRSENGGDTWCRLDVGTETVFGLGDMAFDPNDFNRIYVGREKAVMASSDGGCHFEKIFDWDQYSAGGDTAHSWGAARRPAAWIRCKK